MEVASLPPLPAEAAIVLHASRGKPVGDWILRKARRCLSSGKNLSPRNDDLTAPATDQKASRSFEGAACVQALKQQKA